MSCLLNATFSEIRELKIAETDHDFNSINLCLLTLKCVSKNIYERSSSRSKVWVDPLTEKYNGK